MECSLTLLGDIRAESDEGTGSKLRTRSAFSLLAYLALNRNRTLSREELILQFWPDDAPEAGRQKLRLAVFSIKKSLGPVLVADRTRIAFSNEVSLVCDRIELAERLRLANASQDPVPHLVAADQLYVGPFMPGCYDEWILDERNFLERTMTQCWLDIASRVPDRLEALAYAEKVVAIDPYSEGAHVIILKALQDGGLGSAVQSHLQWVKELFDEIQAQPGPDLLAFARPTIEREIESTAMVGRDSELARSTASIAAGGITTLWGPAGIGKTSLARQLRLQNQDCMRTAWVTAEADAGSFDLEAALQAALGPAPEVILEAQGLRRPSELELLFVDNFEEHVESSAHLLAQIAEANPRLSIVVTSQRKLGVTGERVIEVEPLGVPVPGASLAHVAGSESVRLLRKRLRHRGRDLPVESANVEEIATLCRRMEGNALALELLAEWLEVIGPRDILERLDRSALVLKSRTSGRRARHSSLEAAIETSVSILPSDLLGFAERISVFTGGFGLDAVEALFPELDGMQFLSELETRALLKVDRSGPKTRYALFDSVRRVLLTRLGPDRRTRELECHVDYWHEVALNITEPDRTLLHLQVEDAGNIVQSLEYALVHRDPEFAARMVLAFSGFWPMMARMKVFESQLHRVLKRLPGEPTELQADLYNRIGIVAFFSSRYDVGEWGFTNRLRVSEALGNELGVARAKGNLGVMYLLMGRMEDALPLMYDLYEHVNRIGIEERTTLFRTAQHNYAEGLLFNQEDEAGFALMHRNLELNSALDDRPMIALCHFELGRQYWLRHRSDEAQSLIERSLVIFDEIRELHRVHTSLNYLVLARVDRGHLAAARDALTRLLPMFSSSESIERCADSALAGAWIAFADGDVALGVRLIAAGNAWVQRVDAQRSRLQQERIDARLAELQGPDADQFTQAEVVGRSLNIYEVATLLQRLAER